MAIRFYQLKINCIGVDQKPSRTDVSIKSSSLMIKLISVAVEVPKSRQYTAAAGRWPGRRQKLWRREKREGSVTASVI